jgi:YD repeat-containing protein
LEWLACWPEVASSSALRHKSLTSVTDAFSHSATTKYDARGRRTEVTDRVAGLTTFTYDAGSNLLTLTDADNQGSGGKSTEYAYTDRGLRASVAYPDHNTAVTTPGTAGYDKKTYLYDTLGRVKQVTDQKGDLVKPTYDLAGRMTGRKYYAASAPTTLVDEDTLTYYHRSSRNDPVAIIEN